MSTNNANANLNVVPFMNQGEVCPTCNNGSMVYKTSRRTGNSYLVCSNSNNCRFYCYTKNPPLQPQPNQPKLHIPQGNISQNTTKVATNNRTNNNNNQTLRVAQELIRSRVVKGQTNAVELALILDYGHSIGLSQLETITNLRFADNKVVITPQAVLRLAYIRNVVQVLTLQTIDNNSVMVTLVRTNNYQQTVVVPANLTHEPTNLEELGEANFSKVIRALFPELLSGLITPYELKQQSLTYKLKVLAQGIIPASKRLVYGLKTAYASFLNWYNKVDSPLFLDPELPEDGR